MKKLLIDAAILAAFFLFPYSKLIPQIKDPSVTITISAVGDLMCHSPQFEFARIKNDSLADGQATFDFKPAFSEVRKYLQNSDFTFGNLETVTAGKSAGFSGYPLFNTPDEYISALEYAGFDLLTTANNHSLDQGESGLVRTIKIISQNGLNYNGTFISQEDRDSIRIFDIKGIKVAFLAYTYGTNGIPIPEGKSYLINLIGNPSQRVISHDIKKAQDKNADIILVHLHWGREYQREPNKRQRIIADKIIKLGADIIIGGHPHVLQPVDYFKTINGKSDTGFIAYSLGNFISNQRWRYSDCGIILNISLTKNFSTDSVYISNVTYLPTWVFKGKTKTGNEFIILPSVEVLNDSSIGYLTEEDRLKMKQSILDTKKIVTKYTSKIELFDFTEEILNEIRRIVKPEGLENPVQEMIMKKVRFNYFTNVFQ